jgi:hypothetical protein
MAWKAPKIVGGAFLLGHQANKAIDRHHAHAIRSMTPFDWRARILPV